MEYRLMDRLFTITPEIRKAQLVRLSEALSDLLGILEQDHGNRWEVSFTRISDFAEEVLKRDFDQSEYDEISTAITSKYGGSGSFSDYHNPDLSFDDSNRLSVYSGAVYDLALELRVIGLRH